jgi:hypothetical protein
LVSAASTGATTLLVLAALAGPVSGQEAPPRTAESAEELPPLSESEVARIEGGFVILEEDLDRYLATVYARLPTGDEALQQLVDETLIGDAAARAGLQASEAEVEAALRALDARARAATGGEQGLRDGLDDSVTEVTLRHAVRLHVLHEQLVRQELGLTGDEPVPPEALTGWLEGRRQSATVEEAPLDDPLAASWENGSVSKAAVGRRLRTLLAPRDVSGVLNELIGIELLRREADRLGIELTNTEATREVLDRDAQLREQPGLGDLTYDQFVQSVNKRSLQELIASQRFGAEVILRLITEREWTEDAARELWEADPGAFGQATDWESSRRAVWRELRRRTYSRLFEESRIERRF